MGRSDKTPLYLVAYAALFVPYFIWDIWGLAVSVGALLTFHIAYRIKYSHWLDFTD